MSPEAFDRMTEEVWRGLLPAIDPELRAHFDKIRIVIEDFPSKTVRRELEGTELADHPEELCGLHMGPALPDTSATEPPLFPTRVYLFRTALLNLAGYDATPEGEARLREEIAVTLLHEIGHFFGLEEEDLERLGFD